MTSTFVSDFYDDSDLDEETCESAIKRRRGNNRTWRKIAEFESPTEAEESVNEERIWKKCDLKETTEGEKVVYRCTAGRYRKEECPAGLYLLYHCDSEAVSMFKTESNHANHVDDPTRGLSAEMQRFVKEKFSDGIRKPNAILDLIRQKKIKEPSKQKLKSFLQRLRTETYGPATVSAHTIREWCEARKEIPLDEDTAFVLDHLVHAESTNPDDQVLRLVVSTRRLLRSMEKSDMVQIDSTYKTIWQGYPVMVFGTSDRNQVFHPFGLVVCNAETGEDFRFIFEALHKYNLQWQPSVLLADGSDAITMGFVKVFGVPLVRIMCFFHVVENLEKYLKVLPKNLLHIKQDIDVLQICPDEETFKSAMELFFKKWTEPEAAAITTYFRSQWIEKNSLWYEGAALGYPSTNNGIESTNAAIKRDHTLRARLPVGQFLHSASNLVERWSRARNPESVNCASFAEVRSYSLKHWTEAYQWASENHKVLQCDTNADTFYITSSSFGRPISKKMLATALSKKKKWKTFEEFKKYQLGVWKVHIDRHNPSNSSCSCPCFLKHLTCKHSLGMQIRLNLCNVPPQAKNVPLGQKRKRGRPALSKKALLIQ